MADEQNDTPAADGEKGDNTKAVVTSEAAPPAPDPNADPNEEIPQNIIDQTREGEKPYQWHSGLKRDHGSTDAVEFIDVKKSFGRNTILNGLNLGIPDNQISMILGPSGTGKSVCIKHMVGLLYPDEGDVLVHGRVRARTWSTTSSSRCARSSASSSRTARCSAR